MGELINAGASKGTAGSPMRANQSKALAGFSVLVVGALASGVVLFIVGLVMHNHNASLAATCNSGLGQIGQAVNQQAASMCSHAAQLSDLGIGLVIAGVLVALSGVRGLAAVVIGAAATTRPKSVRS